MPPQNAGYMHAAYVVVVVVHALYALSLVVRRRALRDRPRR